jgi:intracellular septation protein
MPAKILRKIPLTIWEFAPLVIFLLCYQLAGLYSAIYILIFTSGVSLCVQRYLRLKLNILMLIGYVILLLMGGMAILVDDVEIFKMKPTVVNLTLALLIWLDFIGVFKHRQINKILPFLTNYSAAKIKKLTLMWMCYFCCCALLNEVVWRNFSEEIWIYYKIFGSIALNMVMLIMSMILLHRHR